MSSDFDPYHKWLGIPAGEQPPHCYRLLGVKIFEADPDVIEAAADQRSAHLRSLSSGARAELAQQLLNEVAAARICLLDPQRRSAYDAQLRAKLMGTRAAATAQPIPVPPPPSESTNHLSAPPASVAAAARKRRSVSPVVLAAGGVAAIAFIAIGLLLSGMLGNEPQGGPSAQLPPAAAPPPAARPPEPEPAPSTEPVEPGPGDPSPADPAPEQPEPSEEPAVEEEPPLVEEPAPEASSPEPEQPKRLAIPSSAEQAAVKERITGLFELAKSRTREEKTALAKEMESVGRQISAREKPEERWTVLRQVVETAAEAGDAKLVSETLNLLAADFEFDLPAVQETYLMRMAETATEPDSFNAAVGYLKQHVAARQEQNDHERAVNMLTSLSRAAQRPHGRDVRKELGDLRTAALARQETWQTVRTARGALATNADDPAANLVVGRWLFFERNDLAAALPHLAKSNEAKLAAAATLELAGAEDAAAQVALADAWYEAAQGESVNNEKASLLHQAGRWYERAKPDITSQLTKIKVDKRLAEIGPIPLGSASPNPTPPGGTLQPKRDEVQVRKLLPAVRSIVSRDCVLCLNFEPGTYFEQGGPKIRELSRWNWPTDVLGTTPLKAGVGGAGVTFDGVDDCFVVNSLRDELAKGHRAFTISTWFRQSRETKEAFIFDVGLLATTCINLRTRSAWLSTRHGGGGVSWPQPDLNRWHHVAYAWDGGKMAVALNATIVTSRETTLESLNDITLTSERCHIGSQAKTDLREGRYFRGDLDELLMFTRALTLEEIETLYQYGLAGGILGE